jgi:ubiquinone/menaquinone biosynthesis C-methylase UbiE
MNSSIGQDESVWSNEWEQLTPESKIRMRDFYGLRQWISKFTPRYGKVIEAGCGLGRYVIYFSEMGIDIEGVDFSQSTIDYLNEWKKKKNYDVLFKKGNIMNLDYEDNSLSGYISLGVVEHFIEGPKKALDEAFRVLRPGGIAIITTPSVSFYVFAQKLKKLIKNIAKKILLRKKTVKPFFQYWYRPGKLKRFVEDSGLKITVCKSADLLYAFCEMGNFSDKYIKEGSVGYKFSNKFETSFLRFLGSQSVTISVKKAENMHCFICGKLNAKDSSLRDFDVPICSGCSGKRNAKYYLKNRKTIFCSPYIINPPIKPIEKFKCDFCNKEYLSDELFEDFGFSKNVCKDCMKIPDVNIILTNEYVKPVWRKRITDY